jgi:threonine/homoserine/homoserine lactone efflux protein
MASDQSATTERAARGAGIGAFVTAAGAVLVVGLGLAFVFVITLVALGTVPNSQKAAVVTSGFTVLGTIVGAYFGLKAGSAGKDQAEAARDAEAIKVQELAARTDPATAKAAFAAADERVTATQNAPAAPGAP